MFGEINYEDEIGCRILAQFKRMYGIEDEDILYRYVYLRFLCTNIDKNIDWFKKSSEFDRQQMLLDFLIAELNLCLIDNKIYYKNIELKRTGSSSNCLSNIVESWEFSSSLHPITDSEGVSHTFEKYIEKLWKRIKLNAKNKSKKYKEDRYYIYYMKYFAVVYLDELFNVDKDGIKEPLKIEGFEYREWYEPLNITLEHECERYIHVSRFETNNVQIITEKDLEDYIVKNIGIIEEGLRYVDRQVIIQNGRLDILARDNNNKYVIIELKVVEDKELIWQSIYYPIQFKKEHNANNVRFITICPEYPEHIKIALGQNNLVEMIKYVPKINNGKLEGLKMIKVA